MLHNSVKKKQHIQKQSITELSTETIKNVTYPVSVFCDVKGESKRCEGCA